MLLNRTYFFLLIIIILASLNSLATIPVSFEMLERELEEGAFDYPSPTLSDEELNLGVNELGLDGDSLWVATVNGLGLTKDDGASWRLYFKGNGIADDVVISVSPKGEIIACSCWDEYHYRHGGEKFYTGGGISVSTDGGETWVTYGDKDGLDGVEGLNDIPWDIYVDEEDNMWVATYTDGVYWSRNEGEVWEQLIPDDGENSVQHTYDISRIGDNIWIGGEPYFVRGEILGNDINWTLFGQNSGLMGNWYPAVYTQNENAIWVSAYNVNLEFGNIFSTGLYLTTDGGNNWDNITISDGTYYYSGFSLTSIDEILYIGAIRYNDQLQTVGAGIAYTNDYGENWDFITTADGLPSNFITSLAASPDGDELWAGTNNGIAVSYDEGETWTAIDYSKGFEGLDGLESIVYPNPFRTGIVPGGQSLCYFKFYLQNSYSVDLDIYDFAGNKVKTLLDSQVRGPDEDVQVAWFGKNDNGEYLATGVYFYTIKLDGDLKSYGKVAIFQ